MRIIDKRKTEISVGELSAGDAYEYEGAFFLKLSFHSDDLPLSNDNGYNYGVNLTTGVVVALVAQTIVYRVDVETNVVP